MKRGRCSVIRNGHELYLLRERLTAVERAEVEKRERSLGARPPLLRAHRHDIANL
jgi:hypothetical protein